jgi:uncharacterized protein (DUF1501 family)
MKRRLQLPARRNFVVQSSLSSLSWASFSGLSTSLLSPIQVARAQNPAASHGRLVVFMLRGALDGLSLVAPYGDPNYYQLRSNIAIARPNQPDGLLELNSLFGLHPAAQGLMPFWEKKQLAFIHASGSPDPTRSHFDAQDYMESATPGRKTTPDGWLNRLAASLEADSERLRAVNLGPTMPRIFAGSASVASLALGNAATTKGALERPELAAALHELYSGTDKLSIAVREAAATRREIMTNLASDDPKADIGSLSLNGLALDTQRLGQLMARDTRVRLAFVPVGGWDTHANQGNGKGQLANRLKLLTESLEALIRGLGDSFNQTTILVMSEFGRTVRQNGTGGTDHGHGNVAWLMGGRVNGGNVLGRWPGLDSSALHEGRDLAITTDFRNIIATIGEQSFGLSDRKLSSLIPSPFERVALKLYR